MFDSDVEVAVLDCTLEWPRYTQRFKDILENVEVYKVMNKEFPEDPDAIVITGSTYTVPWDDEWVNMLVEKTAEYIENDVPVLGVCFGQQIIAEAVGGDVVDMDDYEIGYRPVEIEENTGIFEGLDSVEYPFSVHRNKVENLPENVNVTARTDRAIQAIEHSEKPVYATQFHPELTPQIAEKSIRGKDIAEERKQRLLDEVTTENFERAKRALKIFENFIHHAERKKMGKAKVKT